MRGKISSFLDRSQLHSEFSHTVLHGENLLRAQPRGGGGGGVSGAAQQKQQAPGSLGLGLASANKPQVELYKSNSTCGY